MGETRWARCVRSPELPEHTASQHADTFNNPDAL